MAEVEFIKQAVELGISPVPLIGLYIAHRIGGGLLNVFVGIRESLAKLETLLETKLESKHHGQG